jgi:hypothetical protein
MMSSPDPWTLSALEENGRDLETPVRDTLTSFTSGRHIHARFLNTLSLMEHIGSRKIMASQKRPDHETLKHLAEETRHAFFFKRAAEKAAGKSLDYSAPNTIAGDHARMYMGRLDAYIAKESGTGAPPYLYMSLVVELRAVWMYRLYQWVLLETGSELSLKSILAEEKSHLDDMWKRLGELDADRDSRTAEFASFEEVRFRSLWSALSREGRA